MVHNMRNSGPKFKHQTIMLVKNNAKAKFNGSQNRVSFYVA